MKQINTTELDRLLENASVEDYERFRQGEGIKSYHSLSDYFNEYIAEHELKLTDVIRKSQLSKDYAYGIFNGHRANPTRDRIIALCGAMNMSLEETQRALKICNAGTLYSKNERDALIMICFNQGIHEVSEINEVLVSNEQKALETSKEATKG